MHQTIKISNLNHFLKSIFDVMIIYGGDFSMMGFGGYQMSGFGLVGLLIWIVILIDLILLGIFLWKKIQK